MPELAEVERCRRTLSKHCSNKRIANVAAATDEIVFCNSTKTEFESALQGRTVLHCLRKGKYLWLELTGSGPCVMFHLGMTGNFYVKGETDVLHLTRESKYSLTDAWPPKATKCLLKMSDDTEIAFVNTRRLGRIRLENDPWTCDNINKLGFDAYTDLPPLAEFTELLRKRKGQIKSVLLDQSFAAGLGNWLADEILYQSVVHPQEATATLSDDQVLAIYTNITYVVSTACDANADATKFPPQWMFHNRWTKKTKGTVDYQGRKIDFVTVGGRTSAFVPSAQKLTNGPKKRASTVVHTSDADTTDPTADTHTDAEIAHAGRSNLGKSEVPKKSRRNKVSLESVPQPSTESHGTKRGRNELRSPAVDAGCRGVSKKPVAKQRSRRATSPPERSDTVVKHKAGTSAASADQVGESAPGPSEVIKKPAMTKAVDFRQVDPGNRIEPHKGRNDMHASTKKRSRPADVAVSNTADRPEKLTAGATSIIPAKKNCTLSSIRELSFRRKSGHKVEPLIWIRDIVPGQERPAAPQLKAEDSTTGTSNAHNGQNHVDVNIGEDIPCNTQEEKESIIHNAERFSSSDRPDVGMDRSNGVKSEDILETSRYFRCQANVTPPAATLLDARAADCNQGDISPQQRVTLEPKLERNRGANLSAFVRRSQRTRSGHIE